MKIVLAADGSSYTKKALAYLVTHEELAGGDGEVVVVNVQPAVPPRVKSMVGATAVADYHREESDKVLKPIAKFLDRHGPGIQQIAYTVADVDAAATAIRARGLRVLYDEARRGTAGSRVNFIHPKDCGGVLVELVEPAR